MDGDLCRAAGLARIFVLGEPLCGGRQWAPPWYLAGQAIRSPEATSSDMLRITVDRILIIDTKAAPLPTI
jgi:hypothetical protein